MKSLQALQKKQRQLAERIRVASQKERALQKKQLAGRHAKLARLICGWLQQDPQALDNVIKLAKERNWSEKDCAWLVSLGSFPASQEGAP